MCLSKPKRTKIEAAQQASVPDEARSPSTTTTTTVSSYNGAEPGRFRGVPSSPSNTNKREINSGHSDDAARTTEFTVPSFTGTYTGRYTGDGGDDADAPTDSEKHSGMSSANDGDDNGISGRKDGPSRPRGRRRRQEERVDLTVPVTFKRELKVEDEAFLLCEVLLHVLFSRGQLPMPHKQLLKVYAFQVYTRF